MFNFSVGSDTHNNSLSLSLAKTSTLNECTLTGRTCPEWLHCSLFLALSLLFILYSSTCVLTKKIFPKSCCVLSCHYRLHYRSVPVTSTSGWCCTVHYHVQCVSINIPATHTAFPILLPKAAENNRDKELASGLFFLVLVNGKTGWCHWMCVSMLDVFPFTPLQL